MGNLRACSSVAVLALVACGSDHGKVDGGIVIVDAAPDAKVFMDAPPPMFDFSCMGNTAPTSGAAMITLSGTVRQVSINGTNPDIAPLQGATVDACNAATATCTGMNKYGTDTSDAAGDFSIGPFATMSLPVNGYVVASATGTRTSYVYPASPFIADQANIPVLTFSPQVISALALINICTQNDAANGMLAIAITDCASMPINDTPNLMLSIKQNNTEVTGTTVLDLGTLEPMAAGTYLVCNVPENATTSVGATYKGMALRAHDVKVVKGTTTTTLLRPGY